MADRATSSLVVPAPRRAAARIVFIRALGKRTNAIRELRRWRLPDSALSSDGERRLRGLDHPFFFSALPPASRSTLLNIAGEERVREAGEWGKRWNLDVEWLHAWAVLALVVWDVTRWCAVPACPDGCVAARDDDEVALELALEQKAMLTCADERTLTALMSARDEVPADTWSIERRAIVAPLLGPHPMHEAKPEFLARADRAWEEAISVLSAAGISMSQRRELEKHCDWLVRYSVNGEMAPTILSDDEASFQIKNEALYKAVEALRVFIDLPRRPRPKN